MTAIDRRCIIVVCHGRAAESLVEAVVGTVGRLTQPAPTKVRLHGDDKPDPDPWRSPFVISAPWIGGAPAPTDGNPVAIDHILSRHTP
jgi:hypothetical protein